MSRGQALTVTVYTAGPSCPGCNATKRKLNALGILYTEQPIDEEIREAAIELDLSTAPIVCVTSGGRDEYWDGYRPDRIDALLQRLAA